MVGDQHIIVTTPDQLALIIEGAVTKALAEVRPETMNPVDKEPLIDRAELVRRLGCTDQTIIRMEKKNKIPSYRVGDNARYSWTEVKEALLYDHKKKLK